MPGIPKGKPQVIPPNTTHDQLMSYDTFFIEINIKHLECKPNKNQTYSFGQVFIRNEAGTKLFCNQPVDHFYIDKIGLIDLFEAYDIEYEFILALL